MRALHLSVQEIQELSSSKMNNSTLLEEYRAVQTEYTEFVESLSFCDGPGGQQAISFTTFEQVNLIMQLGSQGWQACLLKILKFYNYRLTVPVLSTGG